MFKANRKLLPRFNDISPILSAPLTPPYLTLPITQHQIPLCISTLTSAQRRPSCIYPNHSFPRSPQHSLSPDNISTITRPRRRTFSISIAIFTARSRSRSYTGTTTSITLRHVTIIDIVRVILIIWFFIVALDAFWDRDHSSLTPDVRSFSEIQSFDTATFHAHYVLPWCGVDDSCPAAFAEIAV